MFLWNINWSKLWMSKCLKSRWRLFKTLSRIRTWTSFSLFWLLLFCMPVPRPTSLPPCGIWRCYTSHYIVWHQCLNSRASVSCMMSFRVSSYVWICFFSWFLTVCFLLQSRQLLKDTFMVELVEGARKLRHIFLFTDVLLCAKLKKQIGGWGKAAVTSPVKSNDTSLSCVRIF